MHELRDAFAFKLPFVNSWQSRFSLFQLSRMHELADAFAFLLPFVNAWQREEVVLSGAIGALC